jgi:hypothetical protein
MYTFEKRL